MAKIAVCFDTWCGHTQTIAESICHELEQLGHAPSLHNIRTSDSPPLAFLDGIILLGPVRRQRHSRHLRRYVRAHNIGLRCLPSAFFSISLTAAGTATQETEACRVMDRFLRSANWQPDRRAIVAGSLPYQDYSLLLRHLMTRIVQAAGSDTDASRNHEYTDWSKLQQQTHLFADFVQRITSTHKQQGNYIP